MNVVDHFRKLFFCVSLLLAFPAIAHAENKGQFPEEEIAQRGEQLHSDIMDKYQMLTDKLQNPVDIGNTVSSYIPLQISVVDAEAILSKAGASIDYDCAEGVCAKIKLEGGLFSSTEASITLYPDVSGEHARVGRISAVIQHTTLWHREKKGETGDETVPENEKGLLEGKELHP